ncbi:hypothetical protein Ddye_030435 [Dipteronia dyeriana]|uniref:RNase H type-1 domain-containing protein n=1 Tax=Dipteronia dyeriana TaxID=168575 RepID=A0AAD9WMQ8_9ROSI|nr:hypothetical protein Ddye_030435 [Dipteronia dyeriana]
MVFEGGLKTEEELKKQILKVPAVWTAVLTRHMNRGTGSSRFQEIKCGVDHSIGKGTNRGILSYGEQWFYAISIVEWWKGWNGFGYKMNFMRAWRSLFYVVFWSIWESRNNKVFKEEVADITQAEDMINRYKKTSTSTEWSPPHVDALFFNVDSSARGSPGPSGIGRVLQNHNGMVLCMFSFNIGIHDAITSEVLAIAKACEICSASPELARKTIVIVSDSKVVVTWINSDGFGSSKHAQTIYNIRSFIGSSGFISVTFKSTDSNFVTDHLANKGSRNGGNGVT